MCKKSEQVNRTSCFLRYSYSLALPLIYSVSIHDIHKLFRTSSVTICNDIVCKYMRSVRQRIYAVISTESRVDLAEVNETCDEPWEGSP